DTHIGARAFRQIADQRDVDGDRAGLGRRIDPRHGAGDNPVARVYFDRLAWQYVFRSGLCDLQLALDPIRIPHPPQLLADRNLLPSFALDELETAVDPGAHLEQINLLFLELRRIAELPDVLLLRGQPCLDLVIRDCHTLIFDIIAGPQVVAFNLLGFHLERRL